MPDTIYTPIKDVLSRKLSPFLGRYKLTNGALVPSIYVGNPNAKMAQPGLEVVISDNPFSTHLPLLNFESLSRRRFQISFVAWTPDLVGSGGIMPFTVSLTELGELLYAEFEDIRCAGIAPADIGIPARALYYVSNLVALN